jgi:hypothetical protein
MAEVTFNGPNGQTCNSGATTYGPAEPDILDDWVKPVPGEPVQVDGAPPVMVPAPGTPINNDRTAVVHGSPADGRTIVPAHVPNQEVTFDLGKKPTSPLYVGDGAATIYYGPSNKDPRPLEPSRNPNAQILHRQVEPPVTNSDVTIGGGGTQADRTVAAGTDHVTIISNGTTPDR